MGGFELGQLGLDGAGALPKGLAFGVEQDHVWILVAGDMKELLPWFFKHLINIAFFFGSQFHRRESHKPSISKWLIMLTFPIEIFN